MIDFLSNSFFNGERRIICLSFYSAERDIFLTNGTTFQIHSTELSPSASPNMDNVPIFNRNLNTFLSISTVQYGASEEHSVVSQILSQKVSPDEERHQVSVVLTQGTLEVNKILSWDLNNDTV